LCLGTCTASSILRESLIDGENSFIHFPLLWLLSAPKAITALGAPILDNVSGLGFT